MLQPVRLSLKNAMRTQYIRILNLLQYNGNFEYAGLQTWRRGISIRSLGLDTAAPVFFSRRITRKRNPVPRTGVRLSGSPATSLTVHKRHQQRRCTSREVSENILDQTHIINHYQLLSIIIQLLSIINYYQLLSIIINYIINYYQLLSIIINYYQLLSIIINYYQLLSIIINYYQSLSIIINYYQLLSTIINYYQLLSIILSIIINYYQLYYQLLSIIINYYQLLSIIINYYQLLSIIIIFNIYDHR